VRKSFEVACHAGTLPVLAAAAVRLHRAAGDRPDPAALPLALLPAAAAGFLLERPIERRLGGLRSVAAAQIAAGAGMLLADRRSRNRERAATGDYLAVGVAQAVALVPGISRFGAALTGARLRGLSRPASLRLALGAAVPVTLGAAALKATRAAGGAAQRELVAPSLAGAGAAFASAVAAYPLLERLERRSSYTSLAGYRIALGAVALIQWHRWPMARTRAPA
jgi:undecaprenyl-diphosphatase